MTALFITLISSPLVVPATRTTDTSRDKACFTPFYPHLPTPEPIHTVGPAWGKGEGGEGGEYCSREIFLPTNLLVSSLHEEPRCDWGFAWLNVVGYTRGREAQRWTGMKANHAVLSKLLTPLCTLHGFGYWQIWPLRCVAYCCTYTNPVLGCRRWRDSRVISSTFVYSKPMPVGKFVCTLSLFRSKVCAQCFKVPS